MYPRIRKTPRFFTISDEAMSIESKKIQMTGETSGRYDFQIPYVQIPTVQLSTEVSDDNQGMVNIFITQLTTTFVVFETSAPFSGTVHVQVFKIGSD